MRHWILLAAVVLMLSGCIEAGSRAIGAATYTANEATDYVRETDSLREWIRAECRRLLEREVQDLVMAGRSDEARARLRANYPPLVTLGIIGGLKADPASVLSVPFGCD